MLFMKRAKPREFSYTPRFYQEKKDPERRIQFQRKTLYDPHARRASVVGIMILLALVAVLISYLFPRLGTIDPADTIVRPEDVITTTE